MPGNEGEARVEGQVPGRPPIRASSAPVRLRDLTPEEERLVGEAQKQVRSNDRLAKLLPKDRQPRQGDKWASEQILTALKTALRAGTVSLSEVQQGIPRQKLLTRIDATKKEPVLRRFLELAGGKPDPTWNEARLREAIEDLVENGQEKPERLEVLLQKAQRAAKDQDHVPPRLLAELKELRDTLATQSQELRQSLKAARIDGELRSDKLDHRLAALEAGLARLFEEASGAPEQGSLRTSLEALRQVSATDDRSPNAFDSLLQELERQGVPRGRALRDLSAIAAIMAGRQAARETAWPRDLELFYRILAEEAAKTPSRAIDTEIPAVRKTVCIRLSLSKEEFNSLLLDCRERGWLVLKPGTPIGGGEEGIDTGSHRFYYLSLKKTTA